MIRAVTFVLVALSALRPFPLLAQESQPRSSSPQEAAREVFNEMVNMELNPSDGHRLAPELVEQQKAARERREAAIRSSPGAFVPLVREALVLPKPEELHVPTTPKGLYSDGTEAHREQEAGCTVAARILSLFPADMGDPLLVEYFGKVQAAVRSHAKLAAAESAELKRAGDPDKEKLAMLMAGRRGQWYQGRCYELINAAAAARSEVLVEAVFAAFANGDRIGLNQNAVAYLETFPKRREEFIGRLKEILATGHGLEVDRSYNIKLSIKRMENAGKPPEKPEAEKR